MAGLEVIVVVRSEHFSLSFHLYITLVTMTMGLLVCARLLVRAKGKVVNDVLWGRECMALFDREGRTKEILKLVALAPHIGEKDKRTACLNVKSSSLPLAIVRCLVVMALW